MKDDNQDPNTISGCFTHYAVCPALLLIPITAITFTIFVLVQIGRLTHPIIPILMVLIPTVIYSWKKYHNIFDAVESNDVKRLKKLLENDPGKIKIRSEISEHTLLHHAIMKNCELKIIQFLLDQGVDINARDIAGRAVIHRAAEKNKTEYLEYLTNKGADINDRDNTSNSTLHFAVLHNSIETVSFLTENGADINTVSNDAGTPLHLAVSKEYFEISKVLVEKGADVNALTKDGSLPLHLVSDRNSKLMKLLIKHGSNIDTKNKQGQTPIDIAIEKHFLPGIQVLLKEGARMELSDEKAGELLFYVAKRGYTNLLKSLIQRGIDINRTNERGKTPLHLCANKRRAAKVLIENGALINAQDNEGKTPLHYAKNQQVIDMLLENGADYNS